MLLRSAGLGDDHEAVRDVADTDMLLVGGVPMCRGDGISRPDPK